jgi:predicted transposase/invertase (TIGR01784 family)
LEKEITKHNNDIIMKAIADNFRDKSLEVFGLKTPKIVDVIPTVLPVLEVKENRTDFIFLLEDDTLLHLEFQTTVHPDDLKRFALYDIRILNKDNRDINTAVIYSGRIEDAPNRLKKGSLAYEVTNIYMKNFNGDAEFVRLKKKVADREPLTDKDALMFVFLPLMKSEKSESEMAIQVAELAKDLKGNQNFFVVAGIIAITDKFMPEEYKKRLLEVLRMTQIEQWIREEGKIEGKIEGEQKKALEIAKKMLAKNISISEIVDITELTREQVENIKKQ